MQTVDGAVVDNVFLILLDHSNFNMNTSHYYGFMQLSQRLCRQRWLDQGATEAYKAQLELTLVLFKYI